jgi:hypothetical protein
MSISHLLLERVRSLGERRSLSPELQAQIDAIPDMVRDEEGDRDYPDSFYRPLRKDMNPDRVNPSCPGCYYSIGQPGLKCAVNPLGNPATCEHFKPR